MHLSDVPEQPPSSLDRALLARLVADDASPADTAAVERWLAEDPARALEIADLQRIWTYAGVLPSEARLEGLWHDLRRRMHEAPAVPERPALRLLRPSQARARGWTVGALVAASVAAVAAGIGLRSAWLVPSVSPGPVAERVYRTARGQRAVIEFADGSRAQLGADSRIRVRFQDGGRREVHLEGEAVFDVAHDERRPFLVYAGDAVTEDLGTSFGVRAYPGDSSVRVVVVSGKVALRPAHADAKATAGNDAILGPRDAAELGLDGAVHVRRNIDPDTYLAWTYDRFVFHQARVADVATWLERWYDVTIAIAKPATAARLVTLDLSAPSLEEALDAVAVPLGLRYERTGRQVMLH